MENKLSGTQHFYKIIMPGLDTQLPLPEAICQKLKGEHSEVAAITSCKGTWEVKIEKSSSGLISFSRGWSMLAREHDLSWGDFIVFEHCGNMRFTATMFDLTACEKKFHVNSTNNTVGATGGVGFCGRRKKEGDAREKTTNSSASDSSSLFTKAISKRDIRRNFCSLYIHRAFVDAHGLGRKTSKKSIILKESTGEEWPAVIVCYANNRVEMTKGWSDFCLHKNLKVGDTCTFRFRGSSDKCMDVSISRASEASLM